MNKTYDKLVVLLRKGEKEKVKAYCDAKGTSMSKLAYDLLKREMESEGYSVSDE